MIDPTASLLLKLCSNQQYNFIFDVDGTLISEAGDKPITPTLLPLLQSLKFEGHYLCICTSQSAVELTRSITKRLGFNISLSNLFNGGFVLEDGHVWIPPDSSPEKDPIILTSSEALKEMQAFKKGVQAVWKPASDPSLQEKGWGFVDNILYPPVQLAPEECKVIGSVSLWEMGPEITSPEYRGEYTAVMQWAHKLAQEMKLQHTELTEVGNGTLRLLQTGLNKGAGLVHVGFDLSRSIYFGNGLNDLPAAQLIRSAGGLVMAVSNSVAELKRIANAVSKQSDSDGVIDLIRLLLD